MWDVGGFQPSGFNHVPGGSNVLWLDGTVEFMKAGAFASVNLPYVPIGIDFSDTSNLEPASATQGPGRGLSPQNGP